MFMAEEFGTPRMLSEILEEEAHGSLISCGNRHQVWLEKIAMECAKSMRTANGRSNRTLRVKRSIFKELARQRAMEKKYGRKNLGPWSDFEWGMISELSVFDGCWSCEWGTLHT